MSVPIKLRGLTPARYKRMPAINAVIPKYRDQRIPVLTPLINAGPDNPKIFKVLELMERINNNAAICPDLVKAIMDSDEKPGIKNMAASIVKSAATDIKRSAPETYLFNNNHTFYIFMKF